MNYNYDNDDLGFSLDDRDPDEYEDYDYDYGDWDQFDCPDLTLRNVISDWFYRLRKFARRVIVHIRNEDTSEIPF